MLSFTRIESRTDKRNDKKKIDKNKIEHLCSIFIPIISMIILVALGKFYIYPKIVNGEKIHTTKTVSNKVVKKEKVEKTKHINSNTTESSNKLEKKNETISLDTILPESNTKKLTPDVIEKLSKDKLRLARNEIYARHGMVFKSNELNQYFSTKSWYKPAPSYNGELNDIESYNINLIKRIEASK